MASRRRYAQDDQGFSSSPGAPLPRGVRPQRSMVDVLAHSSTPRKHWNTNAPSLPSSPRIQSYPRESRSTSTPHRSSKSSSLSSASFHSSSTFSREQAYESATSIEEPTSKPSRPRNSTANNADRFPDDGNVPHWESRRPSRLCNSASIPDDKNGLGAQSGTPPTEGYGASLWNRISSAANALTINVGKAWAVGSFTDEGEVTPPGAETRLTRALKSYHLNKARATAELPPWLFSEEERKVSRSKFAFSYQEDREPSENELREPRRKGLKAIYANLDAEASMKDNAFRFDNERTERHAKTILGRFDEPSERYDAPATGSGGFVGGHQSYSQSKATSRLQAMRDARRPNVRKAQLPVRHVDDHKKDVGSKGIGDAVPSRRIGLPKGPKQR